MNMTDADGLAKMKEIFDLLLQARYFRIRIQSLSPFDKILGGMAWCIANSNFEIDLDYSDNLTLGQKIRLAEKVVAGLQLMKCPFLLQPHQIQGLDYKCIYPVVQWLIKFVLETRSTRQDYNQSQAKYYGEKVTQKNSQHDDSSIVNEKPLPTKREAKNVKVSKYPYSSPVRVYSALLEQGDLTSFGSYQKLINLAEGGYTAPAVTKETSNALIKPAGGQQILKKGNEGVEIFTEELTVEQIDLNTQGFTRIRDRKKSIVGQQLSKIVQENRESFYKQMQVINTEEVAEGEGSVAASLRIEKQIFEEQKTNLLNVLEKRSDKLQKLKDEYTADKEKLEKLELDLTEYQKVNTELTNAKSIIQTKLSKHANAAETKQAIKLIDSKNEFKNKKNKLKGAYKAHQLKVEEDKKRIDEEWAFVFDESEINKTREEYNKRKGVYDSKFKVLADSNMEVALIQRKIEMFPSTIEIAQYTQRFIEFFEMNAAEYDKQKELFVYIQNKEAIKTSYDNQISLIESLKKSMQSMTKSSEQKTLLSNINQAVGGTKENLARAEQVLKNTTIQKDKNFEAYTSLLLIEREYHKLLREIQIIFEKNNEGE